MKTRGGGGGGGNPPALGSTKKPFFKDIFISQIPPPQQNCFTDITR